MPVAKGEDWILLYMGKEDADQVVQIEVETFQNPWNPSFFINCLKERYCCRVTDIAGKIGAFNIMSLYCDHARILNLCVCSRFQGHGLGRRMLLDLLEIVHSRDSRVVLLEVRRSNRKAQNLYHSVRFKVSTTQRLSYTNRDGRMEDSLSMALSLQEKLGSL